VDKEKKIIIRPEYSAVATKNPDRPSRAAQAVIEDFKEKKVKKVVEIGCGLLANTPHILNAFPFVILVDTKYQYQRIKGKLDELSSVSPSFKKFIDTNSFQNEGLRLDGAIVINVLHVLPTVRGRIRLLTNIHQNLKEKGFIFIDVPHNETYYRDLVKTAKSHKDGYIMKRGNYFTFYKNMTFDELNGYTDKAGYKLIRRIYLDHRITFVCQKS